MTQCKYCVYCEKKDISSTRSDFRKGNDILYYCGKYRQQVDPDDSCKDGE